MDWDDSEDSTLPSANATDTQRASTTSRSVSTDSFRPAQKRKATSDLPASPSPNKAARADKSLVTLPGDPGNTPEVLLEDPLVIGTDSTEDDDLPQVINVVCKYKFHAA